MIFKIFFFFKLMYFIQYFRIFRENTNGTSKDGILSLPFFIFYEPPIVISLNISRYNAKLTENFSKRFLNNIHLASFTFQNDSKVKYSRNLRFKIAFIKRINSIRDCITNQIRPIHIVRGFMGWTRIYFQCKSLLRAMEV